jgi:hypothetical protein
MRLAFAAALLFSALPARAEKDWAVLLYLQAEGDLTPHALRDLRAIECAAGAASGPGHDVVAHLDVAGRTGLARYHLEPARTRCGPAARLDSPRVALLEERDDRPEADRLRAFLLWAVERYPSRRHLIVAWGHGRGYLAGVAVNGRTGGFIDGPALHGALAAAARKLGRPIDVFAADACLMQSVEVVAEIGVTARFVAGSPQIASYQGLPYAALLRAVGSGEYGGADGPLRLARDLPALVQRAYAPGGELYEREAGAAAYLAWSVVDAAAAREQLVPKLHALGAAATAFIEEDPARAFAIRSALARAPAYKGDSRDLGVLLAALYSVYRLHSTAATAPALAAALGEARAALDGAVIAHALGTQYSDPAWSGSAGPAERALSTWVPASAEDHAARSGQFGRSAFYRTPPAAWPKFLARLFPP